MSIFTRRLLHNATFILTIGLWSASSFAGVSLTATRVIVAEHSENQSASGTIGVRSDEASPRPYLVKAEVFSNIEGHQDNSPFVLSPSLFRLEPGNTNQVRVIKKGGALPANKESLFYLRVAALPATSNPSQTVFSAPEGVLNVATGNIIKLFYRPNGLPISQKEAMAQLKFTAVGNQLKVANPSPYYITIGSLEVNGKEVNIRKVHGQNMIAPFEETIFSSPQINGKVYWQAINDYGGWEGFHGAIH